MESETIAKMVFEFQKNLKAGMTFEDAKATMLAKFTKEPHQYCEHPVIEVMIEAYEGAGGGLLGVRQSDIAKQIALKKMEQGKPILSKGLSDIEFMKDCQNRFQKGEKPNIAEKMIASYLESGGALRGVKAAENAKRRWEQEQRRLQYSN